MNRSRALLVLAVVLAAAVGQLSGAGRAYADGTPTFTDISAVLSNVSMSAVAWGDYDSDGDLDFLLTGLVGTSPVAEIYRNDDGIFSEDEDADENLAGVKWSSVAWGDYDSDGDLDILLTGDKSVNPDPPDLISKVYKNEVVNGKRTFTDTGAALTDVFYGSSAWGDYDSDGDLDILLSGYADAAWTTPVSKIYRNNNGANFSEDTVADQNLTGVAYSSVAWGDYNLDGRPDILLTGYTGSVRVSKIYKNNGAGSAFTEDETADENLTAVSQSSVAWGDYDSDGDLDILLTGDTGSGYVSGIYENNGDGAFDEDATADEDLPGVFYGSAAWDDYNSDGKPDILLSGSADSGFSALVAEIWKNNGVHNKFTKDTAGGLTGVGYSSVAWGDYDSDGKPDILLTGTNGANSISRVYQNNATAANTAPYPPTDLSTSVGANAATLSWNAASDTEQAGGLSYNVRIGTTPGGSDVVAPMSLASGKRLVAQVGNAGERTSYTLAGLTRGQTYYWSVQAIDAGYAGSTFTTESTFALTDIEAGLTGVDLSSAAWGDYDSDGDLDILLTGQSVISPVTLVSKIYRNDGGIFNEDTAADINLTGVYYSSAAWGDYDLDGDLDILLTGDVGSGNPVSKIYRNDSGVFNDSGVTLAAVRDGSVAWGDYNSDGKPDIILTGYDASNDPVAKIYKNNGSGTFSEDTVAGSGLTGVAGSSVAWGDYNSDGKLDILLTGVDDSLNSVAKIYKNNGNGTFSEDAAADSALTGVSASAVAWGDYDSDGDLDILLTGGTDTELVSKIYKNNGSGNAFSEDTTADSGLTGVFWGSVAWGDYNSDGALDILLSGLNELSRPVAKIYKNNGSGTFSEETAAGLTAVYDSSVAWGDYNADRKLDVLLAGRGNDSGQVSRVFRNYTTTANNAPSAPAPSTLSASFSSGVEHLSWSRGSDDHTPDLAQTYNLRVRTSSAPSDVYDIVSPLSRSVGTRLVAQDGNVGEHTTYSLKGLAAGTYEWSVQTIDQSFAGSPFATQGTFSVPAPSFAFSSSGYSVNEGGGSASVTIERLGSTVGTDSVHFATSNGSATAGFDYTAVIQTLSFLSGETSKTVSIPIANDSSIEGNETVQLSLSGATLGTPNTAALTIVDNDRAFALSSATYSVTEAGGVATVTINRTGLTSGSDSVRFATANGSATAGSDYTAVSTTVFFAAGNVQKTVSIPITDDSAVESSETVLLSLASPSSGATLGSPSAATLTITDNDVAPPPPAKPSGKLSSAKLSKKSFKSSQAGKVKLSCKFSPKSKVFKYVLSIKKGKKWALVKSVRKTGSFKTYTITVKRLFAGKKIKRGAYRLKLSADKNSKTLTFKVT